MTGIPRMLASQPGLLVSRIVGAALQAVVLILLARSTALSDFGAFGVTLAVGAIALGIGSLGLSTRALRVGAGDSDGIGRPAMGLAAVGAAVSALVAATVGALTTGALVPAVAGAAFVLADGISEVAQNLMFGTHRRSRAAAVSVTRRIGPVVAVAAASALSTPSDAIYLAAAMGALVGLTLVIALVKFEERVAVPMRPKTIIADSVPYWANGILAMIQQLDVVIVGALLGSRAAGAFTAAFRLASPVHIVTSLLVAQMIPSMTAGLRETKPVDGGRTHLRLAVAYAALTATSAPALAYLAVLVLGPQFHEYWGIFIVLFVNSAISVVTQVLTARVFAFHRHQALLPWFTGACSAIGLTIVVIGALSGSLLLAALGTLAIQVTLLIPCVVVERRSLREVLA